ncbi:hypothetical protein MAR_017117 [Mya arenaria]|uniref:DUF4435 domain-containing protein n=1 Tax=Mya arenaria TaxID=6604 RepID=A0ABY7EFG0_MYAAR|nr:hypothetical protein MAR_017117 [Mya arenaria]
MNSKKHNFLLNISNKQNFIDMLAVKLEGAGVNVTKAVGDADFDIVMTAVNYSKSINTVVVGEDTDLLLLLCYYFEDYDFSMKAGKKKSTNIKVVKEHLGIDVCKHILFIHAILGCDAVSKPSGLGKTASLKLFNKSMEFQEYAQQFEKLPHEISKEEIEQHGERALILLYTDRQIDSINDLRVRFFIEKTSSNSLFIDPKTLPPTSSATKYHSLRTYYQIFQWKGLDENPCDYGWMLSNG